MKEYCFQLLTVSSKLLYLVFLLLISMDSVQSYFHVKFLRGIFQGIKVQISLLNAHAIYFPEDSLVQLLRSVPIMSPSPMK